MWHEGDELFQVSPFSEGEDLEDDVFTYDLPKGAIQNEVDHIGKTLTKRNQLPSVDRWVRLIDEQNEVAKRVVETFEINPVRCEGEDILITIDTIIMSVDELTSLQDLCVSDHRDIEDFFSTQPTKLPILHFIFEERGTGLSVLVGVTTAKAIKHHASTRDDHDIISLTWLMNPIELWY